MLDESRSIKPSTDHSSRDRQAQAQVRQAVILLAYPAFQNPWDGDGHGGGGVAHAWPGRTSPATIA